MTNKFILTIFWLALGIGSSHYTQAQSYDKTLASNEYAASPKLSTANVKQRLDKIVDNGFQVTYEIKGKTITASAAGKTLTYVWSKKVKLNERSFKVKAVTKDRALEITTYFIFDEKEQKLIIDRRIRNISAETVNVHMISAYVDPKLVFGGQDSKLDLEATLKRIRAGQLIYNALDRKRPDPRITGYWNACHCDPPPVPCGSIVCPEDKKYIKARWYLLSSDRMALYWNPIPIPRSQKASAVGELPVNEIQFVIVFDGELEARKF